MSLTRFVKLYEDFLKELSVAYSNLKLQYYKENSIKYLEHFIINIYPHMDNISVKNFDIFCFKYHNSEIVSNVTFKHIFNNKENIQIIWKYLQKLYIYSYNLQETKNIIDKLKNHSNYYNIRSAISQNNFTILCKILYQLKKK